MLSRPSCDAKARVGLLFPAAIDGLLAAQQLVAVLLHQVQGRLNFVQKLAGIFRRLTVAPQLDHACFLFGDALPSLGNAPVHVLKLFAIPHQDFAGPGAEND